MTLPLEVWSMLPDNVGYNFIAHGGRELALTPGPIRWALPSRTAKPSGTDLSKKIEEIGSAPPGALQ
jgi:hypothetical protein